MGLLTRLFRGKTPAITQLERQLQNISPDQAITAYHSMSDPELRLPAAISMIVLNFTHRFCSGLLKMNHDLEKASSTLALNYNYDVIAFETAAYCHYWLLKEQLLEMNLNDNPDDVEEGPYIHCLKLSAHITSSYIYKYTTFNLNERFFLNRTHSYSRITDKSLDLNVISSRFEQKLKSSIKNGVPAPSNHLPTIGNLEFEISVKAYIPIFHLTYLSILPEMASNLFSESLKGSL